MYTQSENKTLKPYMRIDSLSLTSQSHSIDNHFYVFCPTSSLQGREMARHLSSITNGNDLICHAYAVKPPNNNNNNDNKQQPKNPTKRRGFGELLGW